MSAIGCTIWRGFSWIPYRNKAAAFLTVCQTPQSRGIATSSQAPTTTPHLPVSGLAVPGSADTVTPAQLGGRDRAAIFSRVEVYATVSETRRLPCALTWHSAGLPACNAAPPLA